MEPDHLKEIRAFNRFYTNITGLLDNHILNSRYSLPEVRIMFELNRHNGLTASGLIVLIDIDKGYLSRIIRRFEKNKLISKTTSPSDSRSSIIQLTPKGKKEFTVLNAAADRQVEKAFKNLTENDCAELVKKMKGIQKILNRKNISNASTRQQA